MPLSDKERELHDFIKSSEGVTIKQIQEKLSPQHVGAMGKLIKQEVVKKEKRREGELGYSVKIVTYYVIVEEGKDETKN